jgi:hypothetical protein
MHKPLPIPQENWRSRWLVLPRWGALHRVAEIAWDDDDPGEMIAGSGLTVCGKRGRLVMPGVLSRMGLTRCPKCCKAMGIPNGRGCPGNDGILEPDDVAA